MSDISRLKSRQHWFRSLTSALGQFGCWELFVQFGSFARAGLEDLGKFLASKGVEGSALSMAHPQKGRPPHRLSGSHPFDWWNCCKAQGLGLHCLRLRCCEITDLPCHSDLQLACHSAKVQDVADYTGSFGCIAVFQKKTHTLL